MQIIENLDLNTKEFVKKKYTKRGEELIMLWKYLI